MNENQNVDIDREQDNGQITYANEVISTIVSVATTEVDGISAIAGNNGLLGKGKLPRGVRVDMNGEDVSVDVSVTVDYGMPIQKVGRSAQENVRKSIESMTGLHVEKVDLHVVGVSFEKENEELQQSQKIALSLEAEEEQHALEEGTVGSGDAGAGAGARRGRADGRTGSRGGGRADRGRRRAGGRILRAGVRRVRYDRRIKEETQFETSCMGSNSDSALRAGRAGLRRRCGRAACRENLL